MHRPGPAPLRPELSITQMLDAREVAREAERTVLALPSTRDAAFQSLYSYLIVDEPSVHLLPLHFLPNGSGTSIGASALRDLGVAAKLEYARNRWLDEMVDANSSSSSSAISLEAHRLNAALLALINARYARTLDPSVIGTFYSTLGELHARHGLSLILDGQRAGCFGVPVSLREYIEHARARHGPMRAPLDAVLLLSGASRKEIDRTRCSWHNWELGVQFYDDALDIEEDFRDRNLSWAVSRTLEISRGRLGHGTRAPLPDPDTFYEIALTEGVVCQALTYAERFFAASARQSGETFPTWAAFQRQCFSRTVRLREDYEKMVAEAKET